MLDRSARRSLATVALAAFALAFATPAVGVQSTPPLDPYERMTPWGRTSISLPDRTNAGSWDGTYSYTNRDGSWALWIRTVDGLPQVKARFLSLANAEGFETDWNGVSDYVTARASGRFDLGIAFRDAETISGRWEWTLRVGRSARTESGEYVIYRTGDGRRLVLRFRELIRSLRRGDEPETRHDITAAWTFRKVSRRELLWDEIPF